MAGSLLAFGLLQDLDAVRSQTASLLLCDLGLLAGEALVSAQCCVGSALTDLGMVIA